MCAAVCCLLLYQILNPGAFAYHHSAHDALDQICGHHQRIHPQDGDPGEPAEAEGQRHIDCPDENTVKQEGDEGLAAGAESEIAGVIVGVEGHGDGIDQD